MLFIITSQTGLRAGRFATRSYSISAGKSVYKWYYRLIENKENNEGKASHSYFSDSNSKLFKAFSWKDSISLEMRYAEMQELKKQRYMKSVFYKKPLNKQEHEVYLSTLDLYFCDLQKMVMKPIYWGDEDTANGMFEDIYEIRRGNWLECVDTLHEDAKSNNKKAVPQKAKEQLPIPVYIAEQIEEVLKNDDSFLTEDKLITIRDQNSGSPMGKIFIQNKDTIFHIPKEQLAIYDNVLTLKLIKDNIFTIGLRKYIRQKPVVIDDIENASERETKKQPKTIHLTFCVHGIGQSLGSKYEYVNFPKTISLFRDNIKKMIDINKESSSMDEDTKIQVLPITWRNKLDFNHPSNDESLPSFAEICPSGAMVIRSLIGNIGLDILLYDDNYYKEKIIEAVISEINSKFQKFEKLHSQTQLKISLIGHSLGSLILFDILNEEKYYKKLDFKVINFFGIGSPVSIFKLIQRYKLKNKLQCDNYYNIFHECDPIGYRIEPLIERSLSSVKAVPVETLSSPDLIIHKVKNLNVLNEYLFSLDIAKDKLSFEGRDLNGKITRDHILQMHKFNTFGRIDYVINSKILDFDMINALKSHVCYFEEYDLINFIIKKLLAKNQCLSVDECLKYNKLK